MTNLPPREHIVAAAERFTNKGPHGNEISWIVMVERPGRHHDCMHGMIGARHPTPIVGEQGFVTNTGRFVDRKLGWEIALQAHQIVNDIGTSGRLFSEHMW